MSDRSTQPAQPPEPFTVTLNAIARGDLADEASTTMAALTAAVVATDKPGEIVVKIKVSPLKGGAPGQITVAGTVTSKLPKPDSRVSIFFADKQGNLHRDDPTTPTITGLELPTGPAPREV